MEMTTMGEIVDLHGRSIPLEDDELIENLARFADGTLSEAAVKARHHLSNEDWAAMGESDRLVELVEACKLRRIRTGADAAAAGARFEITINLGSDTERYSKSIAVDANDVDPHHVDTTDVIAAI